MPRAIIADGYVDLQLDDIKQGDLLSDLQEKLGSVSIRVEPKQ